MEENNRQKQDLERAQMQLGAGPGAMAKLLGVPQQTYNNWRAGRRKMPPVATRCLELVLKTEGKL